MNNSIRRLIEGRHICNLLITIIIVLTISSLGNADSVEYVQVQDLKIFDPIQKGQYWDIKAFQAKEESDDIPSRLCFCKSDNPSSDCFDAKASTEQGTYNFQFVEQLSIATIVVNKLPTQAALFVSEFHHEGGSGSLRLITLWAYRDDTQKFDNVLPKVLLSEQGEYRLISHENVFNEAFVTADYIWGENETHFSPHRFKIKIYVFNEDDKSFLLKAEYTTKLKYKSLDDVDKKQMNIIRHELKQIKGIIN